MVVSLNKGAHYRPQNTIVYYSPYYRDPPNGTPNFGKPPNPKPSNFMGFPDAWDRPGEAEVDLLGNLQDAESADLRLDTGVSQTLGRPFRGSP